MENQKNSVINDVLNKIGTMFSNSKNNFNKKEVLERFDVFINFQKNPELKKVVIKLKETLEKYRDLMDEFIFLYVRKPNPIQRMIYFINPWEEDIEERRIKFIKTLGTRMAGAAIVAGTAFALNKMLSKKKKK